MERFRHFKVQDLSKVALQIIHDGFQRHATLEAIMGVVKNKTGEVVKRSSLQRYRTWWFKEGKTILPVVEGRNEVIEAVTVFSAILAVAVEVMIHNGVVEPHVVTAFQRRLEVVLERSGIDRTAVQPLLISFTETT